MNNKPDSQVNDSSDINKPETPVEPVVPPAQQWQQAPPYQAQIQYVVAQKSLDGIGGWLMFWLVIFALASIGYVGMFFTALGQEVKAPTDTLLMIFAPILAAIYLTSTIFIAQRKKKGIITSMTAIGIGTLYQVINLIIETINEGNVSESIGSVIAAIMFGGLMILYFVTSKRVKATLIS